ncbi:MAG: cupredoxin domain-containing protein [Rhizobiaceae bacterium]
MSASGLNRRRLLISGAAVLAGGAVARAHNGTVHVTIDKLVFTPAEIEVKAGETIEWTNKDRIAHTATVKGGWEVMIPPGKVATRVAEAGDSVEYYCRLHPNMKGRIRVVG